jgi:hypothetical protein
VIEWGRVSGRSSFASEGRFVLRGAMTSQSEAHRGPILAISGADKAIDRGGHFGTSGVTTLHLATNGGTESGRPLFRLAKIGTMRADLNFDSIRVDGLIPSSTGCFAVNNPPPGSQSARSIFERIVSNE